MTNMSAKPTLQCFFGLLMVVVLAGGCRTYGGYGTEAETLEQIRLANASFQEQLARAQADLAVLQRAMAQAPALRPYGAAYQAVLTAHEALLQEHREFLEEAEENAGDYRVLKRTYGAIISEQQIIRDQYAELLGAVGSAARGLRDAGDASFERPYYVVPPYYDRVTSTGLGLPTMETVLRAASGADASVAPDTTDAS
jgi:hypothetical protein